MSGKRTRSHGSSQCPIARTLDLVGDRWSLLVIRDLTFFGHRAFSDFLAAPEGIPTNVLADRLKRLTAAGILKRTPYQTNPVRHDYSLTPEGRKLEPVLLGLFVWGDRHLLGRRAAKTCPSSSFVARAYPRRRS